MSKGLKELKEIDAFIENNIDRTKDNESFNLGYSVGLIANELKALEIIKDKRVNVAYFIYLFENLQMEDKKALKEYNYSAGSKWAITMEELVILKEVLL